MRTMSSHLRVFFILFVITTSCRNAGEAQVTAPREVRPEPTRIPASVSAERRTPVVVAVHNVMPAVVNIATEATIRQREVDPFWGFFGGGTRSYRTQSVGSGFVWAADGVIVTNAHVVEGASRIMVVVHGGDELPAEVVGVDPDSDLAVLRVKAKGLVAAPIGTSADLLIGEPVIAVGNPFGLSGSVTTGVVSATGRSVPSREQGRTYTDFIQTDASINPGNSGGPLLNIEGKVIGINVAIYAQAQNIGFAIPVDRAKKIIEDLLNYGAVHSAWIGAVTMTITPEEAARIGIEATRGALVTRVFGDSPAARAGIRPGDVIVRVGTSPVESRESFSTLTATAAPGRAIGIVVRRDKKDLTLQVVPAEPPRNLGLDILEDVAGITVGDRAGNVFVTGVVSGSRAEQIGLQPGDAIVGANGEEVSTRAALGDIIVRGADRSSIILSVARGRFIYTLTFPMGFGAR
ncbi:MAG: trypsin-like peptidase domain-containing protein [Thermoanaerobaculia bacterium]